MLIKILDITRIAIVCIAFYIGYRIGFAEGYNPFAQLHFMIPVVITALAGISGLVGLLFGRQSAEIKGFEVGSNYQKQSAIAMLSYAVISILVYFLNWGIRAELTILFTFIFFFFFSGINHAVDAVMRRNYRWQNVNRPVITLLLIAGMMYPVLKAMQVMYQ